MFQKMSRYRSILVSAFVVLNFVIIISGLQLPNGGKIWALLVAGSNGYDNYRHQVCIFSNISSHSGAQIPS